jgi:hypothetical protein
MVAPAIAARSLSISFSRSAKFNPELCQRQHFYGFGRPNNMLPIILSCYQYRYRICFVFIQINTGLKIFKKKSHA